MNNVLFFEKSATMRPLGLSAFVRCKNEDEYIVSSLLSAYRVFDEMIVVLNNSTDRTRELVTDLITDHPKIRLLEYANECSAIGPGYFERVTQCPSASLAQYYNWCLEQTNFSHVCKWDGDMIAIPVFDELRNYISAYDVVTFDGYDVLGEHTTEREPRVFKFDPAHTRYVDWDLYEVLQHDYHKIHHFGEKCYLHMKLVKSEWVHRQWLNPNLLATRSVPETGQAAKSVLNSTRSLMRKVKKLLTGFFPQNETTGKRA